MVDGVFCRDVDNRVTERRNAPMSQIVRAPVRKTAIGVRPGRTKEVSVFNRILETLPVVCLATSVAWAAESPFIGDWKLDPSKTRMPDEMKVQNKGGNKYAFDFGGGAETIAVDGSDQPGQGGTLLSVKAEAPDTWIVERKQGGRLLLKATWKLSNDDSTLTDYYREFESDGSTFSMDYVYQRTGGGSGFAADWQSIKETMNSPLLMQVKEFQGDGLSFVTPSRQETKNVKFDGRDYPNEGPNTGQGATSSIQRVNDRTLLITDKYDGKVMDTEEIGLSTDMKTLTITEHFAVRDKKPNVMVFEREKRGKGRDALRQLFDPCTNVAIGARMLGEIYSTTQIPPSRTGIR